MRRSLLLFSVLLPCCAPSAGLRQGYANVNGTRLYYEQVGRGPDLVLVQGGQLGCRMWDQQFEELAVERRVLRYDVRGFGRSGPTGEPYQHHEDLNALLEELGVEQADLVGLSLGGRIALDLALTHPARVRAIVLAGPGLSGFAWSDDDSWEAIARASAAGRPEAAAEAWLEHPYMAPSMERPELRARLRELALENARVWVRPDTERPLVPPAAERLDEIENPVLLLVGTRDVPDIQRICAQLERDLPDLQRIDVEGGGHMLNLEDPAGFNAVVSEFLRSGGAVGREAATGDRP